MPKKSSNVQHFKIKPSAAFSLIQNILYGVAIMLIIGSSLDAIFKGLLLLLMGLEYARQYVNFKNKNHLCDIEFRNSKLFLKRQNDTQFHSVTSFNIQQNRIFSELELYLNDVVLIELFCRDRFSSKSQFHLLMQILRGHH